MTREEFAKQWSEYTYPKEEAKATIALAAFLCGWDKCKQTILKPADGNDLPEFEREVVVFTQNFPDDAGIIKVAFAHRPNLKGFDGKNITTGEVEHYTPKTYGKCGWNIPNVIFWLDVDISKLEEDKE